MLKRRRLVLMLTAFAVVTALAMAGLWMYHEHLHSNPGLSLADMPLTPWERVQLYLPWN